jgi:hypothetical protein
MEKMDQIFSTFFTTKAQGNRMELATSRSIVASHGGQLWAAPTVGGGKFSFHTTATGRNRCPWLPETLLSSFVPFGSNGSEIRNTCSCKLLKRLALAQPHIGHPSNPGQSTNQTAAGHIEPQLGFSCSLSGSVFSAVRTDASPA